MLVFMAAFLGAHGGVQKILQTSPKHLWRKHLLNHMGRFYHFCIKVNFNTMCLLRKKWFLLQNCQQAIALVGIWQSGDLFWHFCPLFPFDPIQSLAPSLPRTFVSFAGFFAWRGQLSQTHFPIRYHQSQNHHHHHHNFCFILILEKCQII